MPKLRYKDFQGTVEISLEDNCLYGSIEMIGDLVMYEGDTVEGLRESFQKAVDEYLEFCNDN